MLTGGKGKHPTMNRDALNALDQAVAIARERAGERFRSSASRARRGRARRRWSRPMQPPIRASAHFSLDDVYLPASYRRLIAQSVHPLFATRGPPGTHDLAPAQRNARRAARGARGRAGFPAGLRQGDGQSHPFQPQAGVSWQAIGDPGGWLVPWRDRRRRTAALVAPINELEAKEDRRRLAPGGQRNLGRRLPARLRPARRHPVPAGAVFGIIHDWRCEQEEGLLGRDLTTPTARASRASSSISSGSPAT